jgi:hypothetical protein
MGEESDLGALAVMADRGDLIAHRSGAGFL